MNEIAELINAARLAPIVTSGNKSAAHDYWSTERVASWEALGPFDKGREFDLRVQRGDELALQLPGTSKVRTAAELRAMFVAGSIGLDAFRSGDVFPLLVTAAATAPAKPIAATPPARPVVPVATAPKPVAVPVTPPRRETTAELYERRRREASGERVAVPAATVANTGPMTSTEIFASRRAVVEAAMARDASARAPRAAPSAHPKPKSLAEPTMADTVFARRRAAIDAARRSTDGGRDG